MDSLNQIEIQNIRHIYGHSSNFCKKLDYYKTLTQDQNIMEAYSSICAELTNLKTKLSNML